MRQSFIKVILLKCAYSIEAFLQIFLFTGFDQESLKGLVDLLAWLSKPGLDTVGDQVNSFEVSLFELHLWCWWKLSSR